MYNFWMGLFTGFCITGLSALFISLACAVNSKTAKAQAFASDQFYYTDSLWFRSSAKEQIKFSYEGFPVSLWVEQLVYEGTARNCKMHRVHINDNCCAIVMKIRDTTQSYYCAYIQEPFLEEEVCGILKAAYEFATKEKEEVPAEKRSLLR